MVGRVTAWPVYTFGVVVEASAGVNEHEYGSRTVVALRIGVDHGNGVAGAYPVGGVTELAGDHHHCRKLGRNVATEPDGRQVDVFASVFETASPAGDVDRYQLAGVRACVAQPGKIFGVGLIRQRTRGQVPPSFLQRWVVAHPLVEDDENAHEGEGNRQQRQSPS